MSEIIDKNSLNPGYILLDIMESGHVLVNEYRVASLRNFKAKHYSNRIKYQAGLHVDRLKEALKGTGYKLKEVKE